MSSYKAVQQYTQELAQLRAGNDTKVPRHFMYTDYNCARILMLTDAAQREKAGIRQADGVQRPPASWAERPPAALTPVST